MRSWALFAALLLSATAAQGQSIGVYSDPECSSCETRILQGETRTLFVCIRSSPRFTRGDFRITGLPASWQTSNLLVASVVRSLNGSPFEGGLHFTTHQSVGGLVNLMSVDVTAMTEVHNAILRVEAPIGGPLICPSLQFESNEVEDCAEGLPLILNGSGSCNVPVADVTWAQVRGLYR